MDQGVLERKPVGGCRCEVCTVVGLGGRARGQRWVTAYDAAVSTWAGLPSLQCFVTGLQH